MFEGAYQQMTMFQSIGQRLKDAKFDKNTVLDEVLALRGGLGCRPVMLSAIVGGFHVMPDILRGQVDGSAPEEVPILRAKELDARYHCLLRRPW